jgi:hypothetical protein
MMARPARVRMRRRKPWVFARRRLFGWNVRLLTEDAFRTLPQMCCRADHSGHPSAKATSQPVKGNVCPLARTKPPGTREPRVQHRSNIEPASVIMIGSASKCAECAEPAADNGRQPRPDARMVVEPV